MMIDDDAGGVTGTCMRFVIEEWLMNHVHERVSYITGGYNDCQPMYFGGW
jgi:hypothetical protein